jgi:hypothetical protein
MSPFYSGGGYCSEAIAFAKSITSFDERDEQVDADDEPGAAHIPSRDTHVIGNATTAYVYEFYTSQFGDTPRSDFVQALPHREKILMAALDDTQNTNMFGMRYGVHKTSPRYIVAVCHAEPGAWHAPRPRYQTMSACPPQRTPMLTTATLQSIAKRLASEEGEEGEKGEGRLTMTQLTDWQRALATQPMLYSIGRTMFETDTIPTGWADRLNFMDEVWVPTKFSERVFAQEGVLRDKVGSIRIYMHVCIHIYIF